MSKKVKMVVPDWVWTCSNKVYINSKELASIFGYSSMSSVASAVQRDLLPKPSGSISTYSTLKTNLWSIMVVRKEIIRRLNIEN